MPKFIFAYHGGKMPETQEEIDAEMAAWRGWFEDMGAAVADGGAPVGMSKTVSASGIAHDGGSNPLSGYSIVNADDIAGATGLARGCPILKRGGSVEVAEIIDMDM